jgi:hypothetical protein
VHCGWLAICARHGGWGVVSCLTHTPSGHQPAATTTRGAPDRISRAAQTGTLFGSDTLEKGGVCLGAHSGCACLVSCKCACVDALACGPNVLLHLTLLPHGMPHHPPITPRPVRRHCSQDYRAATHNEPALTFAGGLETCVGCLGAGRHQQAHDDHQQLACSHGGQGLQNTPREWEVTWDMGEACNLGLLAGVYCHQVSKPCKSAGQAPQWRRGSGSREGTDRRLGCSLPL